MANYVSIYTLRQRAEHARGRIAYWQQKLAEAEADVKDAEKAGEPPDCVSVKCTNHAKYRVGGTEEVCTNHLAPAIKSFTNLGVAPKVEVWPWERKAAEVKET